ncbi:MAG: cation:proton antiporter, partial [Rickettsiales bacterium]|nr:cation:proton antiporter [Rickettsiales bacterium]
METSILIFLGIAMALVALLGKMRISAAFLLAGVLVGPHALGLYRVSGIWNHLADLGIMFLWFGLGLEQNIRRLWSMRRAIFGLGAAQVLCVAALLFPLVFFTAHWTEMCVAMTCLILAISNSGADLQMLADRNELSTKL